MHPICSKRILRGLALCGATVLAPAWALEAPAPSAEALRTLAIAHEHGEGVERNPEQARQLYCQSARLGDAVPQSPWCSETLAMLGSDNVGNPAVFEQLLGRKGVHYSQLVATAWR